MSQQKGGGGHAFHLHPGDFFTGWAQEPGGITNRSSPSTTCTLHKPHFFPLFIFCQKKKFFFCVKNAGCPRSATAGGFNHKLSDFGLWLDCRRPPGCVLQKSCGGVGGHATNSTVQRGDRRAKNHSRDSPRRKRRRGANAARPDLLQRGCPGRQPLQLGAQVIPLPPQRLRQAPSEDPDRQGAVRLTGVCCVGSSCRDPGWGANAPPKWCNARREIVRW